MLITPTPPTDVAPPQVTWDKPANGACVDSYAVEVMPKIMPRMGLGAKPPQKTPNFEVVIEGLSAGTTYMVNVQVSRGLYPEEMKPLGGGETLGRWC
jgi:hypothetical protein